MTYTSKRFAIDELITIAKRENNNKRSYLYVNPLQGKHIPVSPSVTLELFHSLAEMIECQYPAERILIIGFAETATAIGSSIAYAAKNVKYYMNTTREDIAGAEYLFFTESHSHATEQRLVMNGLGQCLENVDRIIFAEDEVTTGNTIKKLIDILRAKYSDKGLKFGIISILNSMSDERVKELEADGILCHYLHHIPFQYRIDEINNYEYEPLIKEIKAANSLPENQMVVKGLWNCRLVSDTDHIRNAVNAFREDAFSKMQISVDDKSILILGTEECMFPGIMIGTLIEQRNPGISVCFHATTRSPIEVSLNSDYPLHNRMPLESFYGADRRTFIYNLRRYDKVFIVTDANQVNQLGYESLVGALEEQGNKDITLIQWRNFSDEK